MKRFCLWFEGKEKVSVREEILGPPGPGIWCTQVDNQSGLVSCRSWDRACAASCALAWMESRISSGVRSS